MEHAERPLAGPHPTVGRPRRPLYECRFMAVNCLPDTAKNASKSRQGPNDSDK